MRIPLNDLIIALSRSLDFVERELLGIQTNHGKRVAYMSARMCKALGLDERDIFDMACCAILHDNALTAYMRKATGTDSLRKLENFKIHCELGEANAESFPFVGNPASVILHHHENWDGSGFHGLRGDEIPLRAAVLRLADNMDLLLRKGKDDPQEQDIRDHVRKHRGTLYAPACVEAMESVVDQDFLHSLSEEEITRSLRAIMAPLHFTVGTQEMLSLCGVFASIVDAKSPFTMSHSTGVAERAGRFARSYGFDPDHRDRLVIAAYLHDVGKLSTPPEILEKQGKLEPAEWEVMRDHVAKTGEILREVKGLEEIATWASQHHEKLNGKGYPDELPGDALSFESRLITCCDIYQALTEDRPYRPGLSHEKAMGILDDMTAKGELDPTITERAREIFAAA